MEVSGNEDEKEPWEFIFHSGLLCNIIPPPLPRMSTAPRPYCTILPIYGLWHIQSLTSMRNTTFSMKSVLIFKCLLISVSTSITLGSYMCVSQFTCLGYDPCVLFNTFSCNPHLVLKPVFAFLDLANPQLVSNIYELKSDQKTKNKQKKPNHPPNPSTSYKCSHTENNW